MDFEEVVLSRPNRFENPILFSDGIQSSGKRMLAHLLASFSGVEKMSHHFVFDYIADLHWLGKISDDAAVAYLQLEADLQTYQLMLSRDQNFRPGDTTSIFSNGRPFQYLRRLFLPEGEKASKRIYIEQPVLHEAPHDGLRSANLYFSAFGSRLRIVHILRNPLDLVEDLIRRQFGWRIGQDPREFQFTAIKEGTPVPLMLAKSGLNVSGISEADLVALMVRASLFQNWEGYLSLASQERDYVKFVFFDDFCAQPKVVSLELSGFLEVPLTARTARAIKRENLPRAIAKREGTRERLSQAMSASGVSALEDAENIYNQLIARFSLNEGA